MGFYIRKAFTFGFMRLNLSRSGLGASFGVKGARLGVCSKGTYVHMGRYGLYYRQYLNSRLAISTEKKLSYDLQTIESADVNQMVDVSSESLIKELNRVKNYFELVPVLLSVAVVICLALISLSAAFWQYIALAVLAIPAVVYARHIDVTKGTALLFYEIDPDAGSAFDKIKSGFDKIVNSSKSVSIEAIAEIDSKYHSGANSGGKFNAILPCFSLPSRVQSNIKVPTLPAGSQTIYFFPDRILVYSRNGVGAVAYKDLRIELKEQKFVEQGSVPVDAKIVGSTWRYVNKKGGPDRRFKDNPEFSITLYEFMKFTSSSGLKALFYFSRIGAGSMFGESLTSLEVSYKKVAEISV